jgi:hypothetical protein
MINQQVTSDSAKEDGKRFAFGYAGYLQVHRNVGDAFSIDDIGAAGERPSLENLLKGHILCVEHDPSGIERQIQELRVGASGRHHP